MSMPMRTRYPNIYFLRLFEEEVICSTKQRFGPFDWRIPLTVEELLRLQYHEGPLEDPSTPRGAVQSFCHSQYAQVPYTVLSARDLWRRGHYLEATLLVRHLLEVFVQMRYFHKHPANMTQHWTAQTPKDLTPFRLMFEDLVPDSYRTFYSLLSKLVHGGGTVVFRRETVEIDPATGLPSYRTLVGSKFDETSAGYIYVYLLSLILGILNHYPLFFPLNEIEQHPELASDLKATQDWLKSLFGAGPAQAAGADIHRLMSELVRL